MNSLYETDSAPKTLWPVWIISTGAEADGVFQRLEDVGEFSDAAPQTADRVLASLSQHRLTLREKAVPLCHRDRPAHLSPKARECPCSPLGPARARGAALRHGGKIVTGRLCPT